MANVIYLLFSYVFTLYNSKSCLIKVLFFQIASAMVACTFISAPLMFVSAKMITLTNTDPSEYITKLNAFTLDISISGTVTCLWVIFVFVLTKKMNRIPHRITACLVFSQVLLLFYRLIEEL